MYHNVSVIVFFALLASAVASPNKEEWEATKQKCITEIGVNPELVRGQAMKEPSSDPKVKCFLACIMKAHGSLKADGTYNLDRVLAKVPADDPEKDTIIANLKECAGKKGANECETASEIKKCFHDKKIPMHRIMGGGRHH